MNKASSIYVVTGDDDFLVDQQAKQWVEARCPPEERALGLEVIDGAVTDPDEAAAVLGQCREAILTVGFFGGRKVVWLRNALFFGDPVAVKSDAIKAGLQRFTEMIKSGLPDGQILIISALGIDGRTAFYKACKAHTELVEFKAAAKPKEQEESVRARAQHIWKELGLNPASSEVLEQFLLRTGSETRQIMMESNKLSSYLGAEERRVTLEAVRAVVTSARESIAWDLQDQLGNRQLGPILQTLRQLLFQKESTIGLMVMLETRLREILVIKECQRRKWLRIEGSGWKQEPAWTPDADGEALLASQSKDFRSMHPYRVVKMAEQAAHYSLAELIQAQRDLAQTHEMLVSSSIPQELLMELMLIRMLAPKEALRRAS